MSKQTKKQLKREVKSLEGHPEEWMKAHNPYYETLADPFNIQGVKIPDMVLYPSATFSIVKRVTVTGGTATHNQAACVFGITGKNTNQSYGGLIPLSNTASAPSTYAIGMTSDPSTCLVTNLFPSTGTLFPIQFDQWNNTTNSVGALFEKARLVSAGLAVSYTGTSFDSKGKMTLAYAPRGFSRVNLANTLMTSDKIASLPGSRVISVNELKGGEVLYKPQDNVSLRYCDLDQVVTSSSVVVPEEAQCGELWFVADGLTDGATFQVTFIANYEGLPRINQLNLITGTISPSDPISLSHGLNEAAKLPSAVEGTDRASGLETGLADAVSPQVTDGSALTHTSNSKQEKSMFDSLLGGVESVMKKALPIAEMAKTIAF